MEGSRHLSEWKPTFHSILYIFIPWPNFLVYIYDASTSLVMSLHWEWHVTQFNCEIHVLARRDLQIETSLVHHAKSIAIYQKHTDPINKSMHEALCEQILAAHLVKKYPEVLLIQNISPMFSTLNPALIPNLLQVNFDTILIFKIPRPGIPKNFVFLSSPCSVHHRNIIVRVTIMTFLTEKYLSKMSTG